MAIIRSSAESATAIPEFWLNEALGYLAHNTVLAGTVRRDVDNVVADVGDTININKRGSLTVQSPAEDADITPDGPTNTKIAITLDTYKAVSWKASDLSSAKAVSEALDYIQDGAAALGEAIETSLAGLHAGLSTAVGTHGTALDLAKVRSARLKMNQANAPRANRWMAVGAEAENDLLGLDKLTDVDRAGDSMALRNATMGNLFGFNVASSNLMSASYEKAIFEVSGATNNDFTITLGLDGVTTDFTFTAAGSTIALIAAGLAALIPGASGLDVSATSMVDPTDLSGTNYIVVVTANTSGAFDYAAATNAASELEVDSRGVYVETHNMAYHPDAFVLAMRPLPLPPAGSGALGAYIVDENTGLTLRFLRQYSAKSRAMVMILDVLYGVKVVDARLACEVRT